MPIPKYIPLIAFSLLLVSCNNKQSAAKQKKEPIVEEVVPSAIQVLNFGTFHMGYTSDSKTIEFDEYDKKNVDSIHQIAKKLARFKPTVLIVETVPDYNSILQKNYDTYLSDSTSTFDEPNEVELLAFEVGRLSGTKEIWGIDHKLQYNYGIGFEIDNAIDSVTLNRFQAYPFAAIPNLNLFENGLSLPEKLKRMNHPKVLDLLITANADILTYAGTEEGFEGADEAAKYYQRNLRIYSNLNRLNLKKTDRVFILMGGSHTAFLREFMERDENYEMVDTFSYLN